MDKPFDAIPAVTTDESGRFSIDSGIFKGVLLVCAHGGTFIDAATGVPGEINEATCTTTYVEPELAPSVTLTPMQRWTLARALSPAGLAAQNHDMTIVHDGVIEAAGLFNAFFDCANYAEDVTAAVPIDPTKAADNPVSLTAPVIAGVNLGALSYQARLISESLSKTPGIGINATMLAQAYTEDFAFDGLQNGIGKNGSIELLGGAYVLPADALRAGPLGFPQAQRLFLQSDRNATGVKAEDLKAAQTCMASGTPGLDLFVGGGGQLDTNSPQGSILAPPDSSFVNGRIEILCQMSDDSGLKAMDIRLERDGADLGDDIFQQKSIRTDTGEGRATFDSTTFDDGPVGVICEATDLYAQQTTKTSRIVINNQGPTVRVTAPEPGTALSGAGVPLACTCEDPQGVRCELVAPSPGAANVQPNPHPTGSVSYLWDTTQEPEGNFIVQCRGTSFGLEPVTAASSVIVDNIAPGQICVSVHAESPIGNAQVVATGYPNGSVLGSGNTRGDGTGCFEMNDSYKGPILLSAKLRNASSDSGVNGLPVYHGDTSLRLLLDDYSPGEIVEGLSINFNTTLAVAFVDAWKAHAPDWLPDSNFATLSQTAHRLVGLNGRTPSQGPLDIRRTPVRDLVHQNQPNLNEEATHLALQALSLARFCASVELAEGGNLSSINTNAPATRCLSKLVEDAQNGVFDGRDGDDKPLYWTSRNRSPLTVEGWRWEKATHAKLWLDNVLLDTTLPAMNKSGLVSSSYDGPGAILWLTATDNSEIFDQEQIVQPWDVDGPNFVDLRLLQNNADIDTTKPLGGVLIVEAEASDPSGVESIFVTLFDANGAQVADAVGEDSQRDARWASVAIDTRGLNGVFQVRVTAVDKANNRTVRAFTLKFDNAAPTLSAQLVSPEGARSGWVRSTEVQIAGAVQDANAIDRITFAADGVVLATMQTPANGAFTQAVTLPSCDVRHVVEAVAVDASGNTSAKKSIEIFCDDTPPAIVVSKSSLASTEHWDLRYNYDESGKILCARERVNTANLRERPTLHRYVHLLDAVAASTDPCANIAIEKVKIIATDIPNESPPGAVFTANQSQLRVEYRYLFNGEEKRSWHSLDADETPGSYALPISYQTLLPENAQPADNFIARSIATDLHKIEIRSVDLAGNVTEAEPLSFFLSLHALPVGLIGCGFTDEVLSSSLSDATLHRLYAPQTRTWAKAQVVWGMPTPAGSLIPIEPIKIKIGTTYAASSFATKIEKNLGTIYYEDKDSAAYACAGTLGAKRYQLKSDGEFTGCSYGLYPSHNYYVNKNLRATHARVIRIAGQIADENETVSLSPNSRNDLTLDVVNPVVLIRERAWSWPTYQHNGALHYEIYTFQVGRDLEYEHRPFHDSVIKAQDWSMKEHLAEAKLQIGLNLKDATYQQSPNRVDVFATGSCLGTLKKEWTLP